MEAWEGKKEEAELVLTGHTNWQTPGFQELVHMRSHTQTLLHPLAPPAL